jgi:hypothetical protein
MELVSWRCVVTWSAHYIREGIVRKTFVGLPCLSMMF